MAAADNALRLLLAELGPEWRHAGSVTVDTGAVLVSDPASSRPQGAPLDPGALYGEVGQSPHPTDTAVAVVCSSGLGDGRYPVVVRVVNLPFWGERVAELRVLFFPELQGVS